MNLDSATQTAGSDAVFKVNGGAEQTRNSNTITDVISGTTLTLIKTGLRLLPQAQTKIK
jgi:flagellar capping protein FliD